MHFIPLNPHVGIERHIYFLWDREYARSTKAVGVAAVCPS